MTNLQIVNILLGMSIMCLTLAARQGMIMSFILAFACTVLAGANRHMELSKLART